MAGKKKVAKKMASKKTETEHETTNGAEKTLTEAQTDALFKKFRSATKGVEDAEANLAAAKKALSDSIIAVSVNVGPGPYDIDGKDFTFINRPDLGGFLREIKKPRPVRKI